MSVDRLTFGDVQVLCKLHDKEGASRQPPRSFHGWYVFTAGTARTNAWDIVPDRTPENEWHAEVRLLEDKYDADDFLQGCSKIASQSYWQVRPMNPSDEEFLEQVLL